MNTRMQPYAKKTISRLGFGAWPLGNTSRGHTMLEDEGIALVRAAYDAGITFFDTAPNYAAGRSETILGLALKGIREKVIINSKFGHHPDNRLNFDEQLIRPSIEGSLKRLQSHYLDSVLLHNPDRSILEGKTGHFDVLEELKKEGLIHAYGVSIDTKEELALVLKRQDIDVVELLFNVFAQGVRPLLDELKQRKIVVIVKVPLDSGWLAGQYHKDSVFTDIRSRWSNTDRARRHALVDKLKQITQDEALVNYALGFIWSYDAVTSVIPGMRTIGQLNEHVKALDFTFPKGLKDAFETLYDDDIKHDPLPW